VSQGFVYLDVNPEPWAVGPLALGRRNGKMFPKMERNASLHAFKEAVREELEGHIQMLPEGTYQLEFYFWRRLDSYIGESGRKANAHVADATNMQKALEDALQGLVFGNDRDVKRIYSEIVEQGPDVVPGIAVSAMTYEPRELPPYVRHAREAWLLMDRTQGSDNTWPPR
jgi:Holliday junction resolvase RusA-like endonuclease